MKNKRISAIVFVASLCACDNEANLHSVDYDHDSIGLGDSLFVVNEYSGELFIDKIIIQKDEEKMRAHSHSSSNIDLGNAVSKSSFAIEELDEKYYFISSLEILFPIGNSIPKTWEYRDTRCGTVGGSSDSFYCDKDGSTREFVYSDISGLAEFQYPCTIAGDLCRWSFKAGEKIYFTQ